MAKVTYSGESHSVTWHGVSFPKGEAVTVDDAIASIMKDNRFFSIDGKVKKAEKPEPAKPIDPDHIEARHKGGAYFAIYRGADELVPNLSKADAEAFNLMTVDEQDDYIAAELAKKS